MASKFQRATSWFKQKKAKSHSSLKNLFTRQETSITYKTTVEAWINLLASTEPFGIKMSSGLNEPPSITGLSGRAAECCELMVDDTILSINGTAPSGAAQASELLKGCPGKNVQLQVRREQQQDVELFKPQSWEEDSNVLGIVLKSEPANQRHPIRLCIAELSPDGVARLSARLVVGAAVTAISMSPRGAAVYGEPVAVSDVKAATKMLKEAPGKVKLHVCYD